MLGKEHPSTLASMNNLASVLDSQDSYDEAEQIHRQTLANKTTHQASHQPCKISSVQRKDHGFDFSNVYFVHGSKTRIRRTRAKHSLFRFQTSHLQIFRLLPSSLILVCKGNLSHVGHSTPERSWVFSALDCHINTCGWVNQVRTTRGKCDFR